MKSHSTAFSLSVFATLLLATGAFSPGSQNRANTARHHETALADASLVAPVMPLTTGEDDSTVKVLALHDAEGTSSAFVSTLNNWRDQMLLKHDLRLEITALQAPVPYGKGYAWWEDGGNDDVVQDSYHKSVSHVLQEMEGQSFDLVVGHGQGAAMTTALLSENKIPNHPTIGYVLNNPSIPPTGLEDVPSFDQENLPILMLTGMRDKVTPLTDPAEVKTKMTQAGATVTEIKHPKGHAVPIQNDETLRLTLQWVADTKQQKA